MNASNLWCALASFVFVAHIAGNLIGARPTPSAAERLQTFEGLTLFPPVWVFSIWLVIWVLQSVLLVRTFGSPFWTGLSTGLFILTCVGNLGSQIAGSRNAPWFVYLACLVVMLLSAFGFMLQVKASSNLPAVGNWSSQIYVGWGSLALLVGAGIVAVFDRPILTDATFTVIGLTLLVLLPVVIWTAWALGWGDYRIVTFPYALLAFALVLRQLAAQPSAIGGLSANE